MFHKGVGLGLSKRGICLVWTALVELKHCGACDRDTVTLVFPINIYSLSSKQNKCDSLEFVAIWWGLCWSNGLLAPEGRWLLLCPVHSLSLLLTCPQVKLAVFTQQKTTSTKANDRKKWLVLCQINELNYFPCIPMSNRGRASSQTGQPAEGKGDALPVLEATSR